MMSSRSPSGTAPPNSPRDPGRRFRALTDFAAVGSHQHVCFNGWAGGVRGSDTQLICISPGGGTVITVGTDADDGKLADVEIDETVTVCNVDGGYHGCVRFDDGSVACLGTGVDEQLGVLSRDETELDVPAAPTFTRDLTAGVLHTSGITDDGLVTCWGEVTPMSNGNARFHPSVTDPIQ